MSVYRRMQIDPYISPYTTLRSKQIKDLSINTNTLSLGEEVEESYKKIGIGDNFLKQNAKSEGTEVNN